MVITMKKTVLFLMVVSLMIGVCGCGMKSNDEKRSFVLKHMENKYSGSFEIVSFIAKNIDMPYDELVIQDQYGNKFFAYIKEDEHGNEIVQDAYYGVLKADDYDKILRSILDKYFSDYKFFSNFTAGYFDNKYDCNYALSDALKENKVQFFSDNYVFICEENLMSMDEAVYDKLTSEFEDNGLTLYIAVYSVSAEELNRIDEAEDVNLFLPGDYKVNPVFKKTIK